MCRNQSEVTTILNSCGLEDADSQDELEKNSFEEGIPNLARLRLAVRYNQKQAGFFSRHDTFLNGNSLNMFYNITLFANSYIFVCSVCSPPHLPAGSFIHLVWKLVWLERQ